MIVLDKIGSNSSMSFESNDFKPHLIVIVFFFTFVDIRYVMLVSRSFEDVNVQWFLCCDFRCL